MNTKILAEQGYDLSRLKTNKTRLRFKKLLRWLFVLVLIILLSKFVLDYIAGFPRERFAKDFGYWKRVWLGGKKAIYGTYLELVAPHDDPKASKLKVVDLFIKGQALDKLKSNLPESGSLYQSADFRIEDKIYQASARFRGDSINHWAFPQKSWRVRFKKGKDYEGMPLLNLTVPRVETQFANWLGYELGNRIGGLLVPRAELVHFRLNRKFDGVRMLLEQPDQDFLINRNLATGKIYNGDIDSSQIYGNVPRKPLYKDYSAWKLDVPGDEESPYPAEMIKLVKLIKDSDNPYEFFYSFRDLMDVQALASYMALLEIVGSVHVDETHNGKFYFNPSSGKFQPIVWDTVAYLWKNQKAIDLGSNSLFRKALSIPEIRELKDQVLWNSLNGNLSTTQLQKLIDKQADTVRSDVYAFAHKIHANDKGIRYVSNPEWEAAVEELKTIVQERNQDIIAKLLANDSVYRLKSEDSTHKLLGIEVRSLAGLLVDQLTLQTPGLVDGTKLVVRRLGLADLLYPEKDRRFESFAEVKNGKVEIRLEDKLYSKRKFKNKKTGSVVPAKYVYQIILPKPSEVSIINISAKNSITKADYTPVEDPNLELGSVQKANIVWWNPDDNLITKDKILSGNIEVKEDLILDKYTNLIIKAGTNLKVHPGVSIIAKGANVEIQGTKSAPVTIQAFNKAKKWGVFAVNGSQNVKLKDLVVSDGSYAYHDFVNYTGAISIHNSKAYVENSQLNGSYLSVQNSDLEIKNSQISNTYPFDLRSENSVVQKIAVVHQQIKPVLNADIMQGDAYGTPSRIEREHKYSILDHTNEVSLDQLAEEIRVALSSSMEEAGLWKVPDMINSKLYADTSTGDFAFRDIYFDTADGLAYKHALSYRYRNRFGSLGSHKRHLKKPNAPNFWPRRLEFQAKTGREETGAGFSTVGETRFEFRKESKPFNLDTPPPGSPWDENEFLSYMQSGNYKGMKLLPARDAYAYIIQKEPELTELAFRPELVLVTERYRQHLNIKTPWGSGPNPDQSYIISLDRSHIYIAPDYLDYLNARKLGDKEALAPKRLGYLTEIEIEFERNVSDKLDQAIKLASSSGDQAEVEKLEAVRDAFIDDQNTIMKVVQAYFAKKGVKVKPANKSKYTQSYEIANLGTKLVP